MDQNRQSDLEKQLLEQDCRFSELIKHMKKPEVIQKLKESKTLLDFFKTEEGKTSISILDCITPPAERKRRNICKHNQ